MLSIVRGKKPHSSKVEMFFGGSLPVTSTGISSYLSKLIPALMVEKIDCSSSGGGGGM